MERKFKIALIAGTGALLICGVGAGVAAAVGGDSSTPITGTAYQKAASAALAHTGGGRVTDTEVGDEESYYQVEVTLPDGSQTDVQLDRNFNVVGSKTDSERG
jgi:uncharacterized membrane protein YkoI